MIASGCYQWDVLLFWGGLTKNARSLAVQLLDAVKSLFEINDKEEISGWRSAEVRRLAQAVARCWGVIKAPRLAIAMTSRVKSR